MGTMSGVTDADPQTDDEVEELVARLDVACVGCPTAVHVERGLILNDEERAGPLGIVKMAFQYAEGGPSGGAFFGEQFGFTDGSFYPPRLRDVDREHARIWEALSERAAAPVARARLHDLCFEGRWGHGGEHAAAAAEAYLELSAVDAYALPESERLYVTVGRVTWLGRALGLARRHGDQAVAEAALDAMIEAAEVSLAQPKIEAGVTLGHIESLVDDGTRPEVDELLLKARQRYVGEPHHTASTIELQLRRAGSDDAERTRLQRELVIGLLDHADVHIGLIRMHFLEQAAKLARDFGGPCNDLRERAIGALQAMTIDDLDLKAHPFTIEMPVGMIEARMTDVTTQASWEQALTMLIDGSPTGRAADSRAAVARLPEIAPLSSLLPRMRVGGDGLPRTTTSSEDDVHHQQLIDHEVLAATLNGTITARALMAIWEAYGPIEESDLANFFARSPHVSPRLAAAIARAFLRFFNGDAEGALFTAAPRVETLVREIVLALDLPVYRTQLGNAAGQYPGFGALLQVLADAGLDESWFRFLNSYFAAPAGGNMRNEALHGFVDDPTDVMAALALTAALYLALGPVPVDVGERSESDAGG